MGDKRRAILAARQLKGAGDIAFGMCGPRPVARERLQARGERGTRGREPPALIPQAHPALHEVLGLGVGEHDPAIPGQKENGETGGRDRRAERLGCCFRPGQEIMDRCRALQMWREGFQEMPFRRLHPNRIGRSCKSQ